MGKEGISFARTSGGIPVLIESIPGCESAGFMVGVRTGSRDEDKRVWGISHLLEHVVFRETKNRSSYQMAKEMEGAGGEMNAFTGREMTAFFGVTIKETKDVAKDTLADIVVNPLINEKDVELEKKIVLQELSMIENEPHEYIHDLFTSNLWRGHKLSQDEGGKPSIVKKMSAKDLREYYEDRYGIPNISVFAAGSVDIEEVTEWAEASFDDLTGKKEIKRKGPGVPSSSYSFTENSSEHYHIGMGFPSYGSGHKDRTALTVLSAMIGSGTSSRLFQEVREKRALVYSVFNVVEQYSDAGAMATFLSATEENTIEAMETVARTYMSIRDEGPEAGEMERTKNLIKGVLVRSLESTERRMYRLGKEYLLSGKYSSLGEKLKEISEVTEEDVMRVASDIIRGDRMNISVLGRKNKEIEEFSVPHPDV
jgi:predicted Zn-dependent peptidase